MSYYNFSSSPHSTAISVDSSPSTPKAHNKRRSSVELNDHAANRYYCDNHYDPNSNSSNSTINTFDCHSLQQSLKRVRLSTNRTLSPGELRLQRDLRHAVLKHHWVPVSDHEWTLSCVRKSSVSALAQQQQMGTDSSPHATATATTTNATRSNTTNPTAATTTTTGYTVTRNGQDPMELVLTIRVTTHHAIANSTATTTAWKTTKLHLHFPRLYPHQPPVVRRIDHHPPQQSPILLLQQRQQQEYAADIGGTTVAAAILAKENNPWYNGGDSGTAASTSTSPIPIPPPPPPPTESTRTTAASTTTTTASPPQLVDRIVIAESPDAAATVGERPGTIVWKDWTPLSRLSDICDWLIESVLVHQQEPSQTRQAPQSQRCNEYCDSDSSSIDGSRSSSDTNTMSGTGSDDTNSGGSDGTCRLWIPTDPVVDIDDDDDSMSAEVITPTTSNSGLHYRREQQQQQQQQQQVQNTDAKPNFIQPAHEQLLQLRPRLPDFPPPPPLHTAVAPPQTTHIHTTSPAHVALEADRATERGWRTRSKWSSANQPHQQRGVLLSSAADDASMDDASCCSSNHSDTSE